MKLYHPPAHTYTSLLAFCLVSLFVSTPVICLLNTVSAVTEECNINTHYYRARTHAAMKTQICPFFRDSLCVCTLVCVCVYSTRCQPDY